MWFNQTPISEIIYTSRTGRFQLILSSHKLDLVRPIPKEAIFGWAKNPKKKKEGHGKERRKYLKLEWVHLGRWRKRSFAWDRSSSEFSNDELLHRSNFWAITKRCRFFSSKWDVVFLVKGTVVYLLVIWVIGRRFLNTI